jgi:hypothetical protein
LLKSAARCCVELLVLVLELVALFSASAFCVGVREFLGDPLLPRIDGVRMGCRESASAATPG